MDESGIKKKALIAGLTVVAVTVVVMIWPGGGDDSGAGPNAGQPTEEIIEVEPMVPRGRIASASWRTEEAEPAVESEDEGATMVDAVDWENFGTDPEAREKYDKSLEEAMRKVQGLSVVVATEDEDDDDEDEPKKEAPRKRK